MKEKIFIVFNVILLIAFCCWGVCNDSQTSSEIQSHNHAKVVHETVTVYY